LLAVAVSSALTLALGQAPQGQPAQPSGQAAQQPAPSGPQWKDRAEYDLAQQIMQTTDGQKKLSMLDQWTQKYPQSEMNVLRMVQYLDAYRLLNQRDKMIETARKILAADPKNLTALYWTAVIVPMGQMSPQDTEFATQAATQLADNLETLKPAGLADADWQKTKDSMKLDAVGHRALGFIAMTNKDYPTAEKHLRENLQSNAADAEASFWLGTSILGQKQAERQSEALFYFARAAAYDGPGAVDPNRRKQLLDYVTKAYTTYHGGTEGLDQVLATAKQNPTPPSGFKILSEQELKDQKLKQLAAEDPSLAFWVKLKDAVRADPAYFESGMKGALIPPESEQSLRAIVISATPEAKPKQVVLGIQNPNTPEVTLNLAEGEALPGPAAPGTQIRFRGVPTQLQTEPFMMTFDVERKQIEGWPVPEKKAPVRKGGAKKKK
jgi:tetratricopeptide (TPR) repeat protein